MSKALRFSGHSDDTFGEYGSFKDDWDNCASGKPIMYRVKSGDSGLVVIGQYAVAPGPVWLVGVAPLDEDKPLPEWNLRYRLAENGYSPELLMDVPDDATLEHLEGRGS